MPSAYNLLDEPWLPVQMPDGEIRFMGLLEAMAQSGDIKGLAETSPTALVAEYRILLAVTHRALVTTFKTWKERDRLAWYHGGLPAEPIREYLESQRRRFWLFDDEHPFMQVAALATAEETRDKRKPWTQISLASANGNTPVVFDHAVDAAPQAISTAAAVAHLLSFLQFTPGGLVKTLRDADKAGPLVNTAAVLPVGDNLAQTLVLALHDPPLAGRPEEDLPAWERDPLTLAQLKGEPVLATGPNDRYTRQSRAVLLDQEPDDEVRWLRFGAGFALGEDTGKADPMACFRAGTNGLVRVSFYEGRAAWRDLPALIPVPRHEGYQAAAVVQSAIGLLQAGGIEGHQALLVAGLASDQAKLLRWRLERFALPSALLTEPERALDLQAHVALVEEVHRQLRRLACDLVVATLPDPGSKDTANRARAIVESGPITATFFAAAETALPALMALVARDDAEAARVFWHDDLRKAALLAWQQVLSLLGMSPRALRANAQVSRRLHGMLRKQLPSALSKTAVQPEEFPREH